MPCSTEKDRIIDDSNPKADNENFEKGKLRTILIFCIIVSAVVALLGLTSGIKLYGVIALVQAALYITALLIGSQIIKCKKKNLHKIIFAIAIILYIPFFMTIEKTPTYKAEPQVFAWESIEMGELIPEPATCYGEIYWNFEDSLSITLCDVSKDEYRDYINRCTQMGFIVEAQNVNNRYKAFNRDGYEIILSYWSNSDKLDLYLAAPVEMDEIEWPTQGPGSMLPKPVSTYGEIQTDNAGHFYAHIGNMSLDEYMNYITQCEAAGFNVACENTDYGYYACNSEGYRLTLRYVGFNTIAIRLDKRV